MILLAHDDTERWAAVCNREASRDGEFFYAVRTTGVYCRPSCAAPRPRRENVTCHRTSAEAESAGYRPCKRCHPDPACDDRWSARIVQACRLIESLPTVPSLEQLAAAVHLSSSHFHRLFKRALGVTLREYARAQRGREPCANLAGKHP